MAEEVLEVGEGEASSFSRGFVLFTIWNAFLMDSETLPWPLVDFKTLVRTLIHTPTDFCQLTKGLIKNP